MALGGSAPGAPAAQDGFTPKVGLWYFFSPNRISQSVNPTSMTIVNRALPGHEFEGTVTIQVSALSDGTSNFSITGTGISDSVFNAVFNDAAGLAAFGFIANSASAGCLSSPGSPLSGGP